MPGRGVPQEASQKGFIRAYGELSLQACRLSDVQHQSPKVTAAGKEKEKKAERWTNPELTCD